MRSDMHPDQTHMKDDHEQKGCIQPNKKILIVAGEASGDLHGANLVWAMHHIDPALRFYGVGGERMKDADVERLADSADMAVVGFTEVIGKLQYIMGVRAQLKSFMEKEKPALLIVIDYPDFNIPLAKTAKKLGVRVFYYISPQVWAWRRGRVKTISRIVDAMAVILPFEEELYRKVNVNVQFVGHPLLDVVKTTLTKEEARNTFALRQDWTTICLLPGSRKNEVAVLLPEMLKAAKILKKRLQNVQFVLPLADTLQQPFVEQILQKHAVDVKLIRNNIYDVVNVSDLAVVASGTATLETALLEIPMIIVYKVSRLSYYIGKTFIKISNIGLVNIVAGKTIVPELIQDEANGERIAGEAMDILTRRGRLGDMKADLGKIKDKLGKTGASVRAARLAYNIIRGAG
jgi:lipid-A-disaccharide synthase